MKYCLCEEPGPMKQDYKDHFSSNCLFLLRTASQILEIFGFCGIFTQIKDAFSFGMTSLANTNVSK